MAGWAAQRALAGEAAEVPGVCGHDHRGGFGECSIDNFFEEAEALHVNKLDRDRLIREGADPADAMTEAAAWVRQMAGARQPVLVAFPLSFDWTWLYWYLTNFSRDGSPFGHSSCFDIKIAFAVKSRLPISAAGRSKLPVELQAPSPHTHHAVDDAREQAEVFARLMEK